MPLARVPVGTPSPLRDGRNGWLEGVWLTQQHKREEKHGPYRKSRLNSARRGGREGQ